MFRVYGLELTLPIVVVQFDHGPTAPPASRVGHYYCVTGAYAQDKPKDYLGNVPRKNNLLAQDSSLHSLSNSRDGISTPQNFL